MTLIVFHHHVEQPFSACMRVPAFKTQTL